MHGVRFPGSPRLCTFNYGRYTCILCPPASHFSVVALYYCFSALRILSSGEYRCLFLFGSFEDIREFRNALEKTRFMPNFSGLFTVHFFCSVHMVIVSKYHGYKWFAVMVFTLSRLEHGWFRRNSVCCGPVTVPG